MQVPSRPFLAAALAVALAASAHAQRASFTSVIGAQAPAPAPAALSLAFTVDPSGTAADFQSLSVAVATVPSGSLLFLKSGIHLGAVDLSAKSLRLEAEVEGATWLAEKLTIRDLGAQHEVSVSGLAFMDGFEVESCLGDVSFAQCTSALEGGASPPAGVPFSRWRECGMGLLPYSVTDCTSVTFVDCTLTGRDGVFDGWDGTPGEHGLRVTNSIVSLYGCQLDGGDGGSSTALHGFAGAGGDGLQISGPLTAVRSCETQLEGGIGGDSQSWGFTACHGTPLVSELGATFGRCALEHVTLSLPAFVRAGTAPTYEISAPPGSPIFLMMSPQRGYRSFPAGQGVMHLGFPVSAFALGVVPAAGSFSRPFLAPQPDWAGGYGSLEVQAYARIQGQDYYSEPRSVVVIPQGL